MYMARLGVQKMDGAEEDVLPLPPFEGLTAVFDSEQSDTGSGFLMNKIDTISFLWLTIRCVSFKL